MKINKQLNRNNIDLMNIIYIDRCSGEISDLCISFNRHEGDAEL